MSKQGKDAIMMEFIGKLQAKNMRFAIVVSRFNELITRALLAGALEGFQRFGVEDESVTVAWVPGAHEIPIVAKRLAQSGRYDSIICLGAVIRGATTHFDYVAGNAASGIAQISLETGVPVIFGVLTLESIEQGLERAGSKAGNKGFEAAQAAIEMVDLMRQLPKADPSNAQLKTLLKAQAKD